MGALSCAAPSPGVARIGNNGSALGPNLCCAKVWPFRGQAFAFGILNEGSWVFVVFEGVDGAGKSTLIKSVESHLRDRSQNVLCTREPGGTPLAEEIRSMIIRQADEVPVPRTELLLYEAARAQHVEKVIRPFHLNGCN